MAKKKMTRRSGSRGDSTAARTSTASRTATRTATATDANTQGNVTVTGGAGAGATTSVTVRTSRVRPGAYKDMAKKLGAYKHERWAMSHAQSKALAIRVDVRRNHTTKKAVQAYVALACFRAEGRASSSTRKCGFAYGSGPTAAVNAALRKLAAIKR